MARLHSSLEIRSPSHGHRGPGGELSLLYHRAEETGQRAEETGQQIETRERSCCPSKEESMHPPMSVIERAAR